MPVLLEIHYLPAQRISNPRRTAHAMVACVGVSGVGRDYV
ncbi:MAG: hypothetical protein QOI57_2783, partial [Rubrobacteraceae bacterium]|nr:hypothetical protein [Rubrobacteraceae bacterium]